LNSLIKFYFFLTKRYHEFYLGSKGNLFKNKTVLIEAIHVSKADKAKSDKLTAQQEARRAKNAATRVKRNEKAQIVAKVDVWKN